MRGRVNPYYIVLLSVSTIDLLSNFLAKMFFKSKISTILQFAIYRVYVSINGLKTQHMTKCKN